MKKILFVVFILFVFGCTNQTNPSNNSKVQQNTSVSLANFVQVGDTVSVDYVGTLNNGSVFDTSIKEVAQEAGFALRDKYEPMTFVVGQGKLIKAFENGVIGMKVGEEKNIHILAKDAYGEVNPENIIQVPLSDINAEGIVVGSELQTQDGFQGVVTSIENETATIDFNHPLAGKDLNFKIILRKLVKN